MYHVFYVNDGYMLALDLPPVGCFRDLHHEILLKTGVLESEQVFFLGGGEALIGDYLLSSYADAGTDTNPIYFIKRFTTEKDPINSREEEGINNLFDNWKRDVDRLHQLPIKIPVVGQYCEAGEAGIKVAETLIRYCAKIVSEHQYLNHGWAAVTTNLDENVAHIASRFTKSYRIAQRLPHIRKRAHVWVDDFQVVFDALSKIHIPCYLLSKSQNGSTSSTDGGSQESMTLYEWIEQQDPVYSLEALIEHVSQNIERLDDDNLQKAAEDLKVVKELTKRKDYRDIRGIDKRLAMLDTKLGELEEVFQMIKESAFKLVQVQADQNNYRSIVLEQRDRISRLSTSLEEFTKHAHLFLSSKLELLKNVRQRLAGWIRQGYERLQQSNTSLILFEEKFGGFRQRLDLVRQIREAPILFVATVAEVIRRKSFRLQFDLWLNMFIQKCSEFIKEENYNRAEFFCKLEKHFLRDIFKGLNDELPNFCPHHVKFDSNLPNLDANDLRALREALNDCLDMPDLFKVIAPQVFHRLTVEDPNAPQQQHVPLHREESFFVRERTANINVMQNKFPSSNWLSGAGDEHVEMSPSSQFFLSKTIGSTTSLNTDSNVTTPSDLLPNLESIKLMHRDSIPREIGIPSSVDLTCPSSIHPEKHPKGRSSRSSRGSTPSSFEREYHPKPIFEEGVPVLDDDQDEDNLKVEESITTTTPLYTPMLSPARPSSFDESLTATTKAAQTTVCLESTETQTPDELQQSRQIEHGTAETQTLDELQDQKAVLEIETQTALELDLLSTETQCEHAELTDTPTQVELPDTLLQSTQTELEQEIEREHTGTQMDVLETELKFTQTEIEIEHVGTQVDVPESLLTATQTDSIYQESSDFCTIEEQTNAILKAGLISAQKEFNGISEGVKELKNEVDGSKNEMLSLLEAQLKTVVDEVGREMTRLYSQLSDQSNILSTRDIQSKEHEEKLNSVQDELEKLREENKRLSEIVEHEKYLRKEKEHENTEKSEMVKRLNDDLLSTIKAKDEMQADLLRVESEKQKLESKLEADQQNVDYLSIEIDMARQFLKRDLQPDEMEWIKAEIEKRKNIKPTVVGSSSPNECSLRTEYESAYKNKIAFLIKGIEDKKNDEIAKLREEIENEQKDEYERYVRKLKERIGELEDKNRFYESSTLPSTSSGIGSLGPSMMESMSVSMAQSCLIVEEDVSKSPEHDEDECESLSGSPDNKSPDDVDHSASPVIVSTASASTSTQTKLKLKDMKFMISLNEVSESLGVLLSFSHAHNQFMVFSTTGTPYFVKQRSLRRLGIEPSKAPPRYTLFFARVVGVELCETKKAPNRYHLLANTRFYRVDVAPMPSHMAGLSLQISDSASTIDHPPAVLHLAPNPDQQQSTSSASEQ